MDPGTGLAILGTAIGSKEVVVKILGPTAEYLGDGLRYGAERGVKNIGRIFQIAAGKLGDKINEPGTVPPKVLKGIVTEGAFCEDPIGAEYFGGVLASSRSGTSRDDRGAVLIALLSRLSAYQIRTHYIVYTIVRDVFAGSPLKITTDERRGMSTYIPIRVWATAMALDDREVSRISTLLAHTFWGLLKEDLIGDRSATGDPDTLRPLYAQAPESGIVVEPTAIGAELFLWAHGRGDAGIRDFISVDVGQDLVEGVVIPKGYERILKPKAG